MHIFRISEPMEIATSVQVTDSKFVMYPFSKNCKLQSINWVGYKRSQLPTLNLLLGMGLVQ